MENPLKARVMARLAELNLKPSSVEIREALEREGLNKTYIYELVAGRKGGVPQTKIPVLARVLGVSQDYLNGTGSAADFAGVKIVGIAEGGAWREADLPQIDGPMIVPDNRVRPDKQVAYLVRGNHAEIYGINDASVIVVGKGVSPRAGEVVVMERARADGMKEIFISKFCDDHSAKNEDETSIIGVVLMAIKTF